MSLWLLVSVVFGCYIAATIIYSIVCRKWQPWIIVMLGFAYVSDFVLIELKIGRPSIRIYFITVVFIVAVLRFLQNRRGRVFPRPLVPVSIFFLVLYGWVMFTSLLHSYSDVPLLVWGMNFVATYVTPQMFFFSAIVLLQTEDSQEFLAWTCVTTVAISALFAILQFLNVGFAESIHESLYPITTAIMREDPYFNVERVPVHGLASYSVPFAVMLITFGPLALSYSLFNWKRFRVFSILCAMVFALVCVSLFCCKSRAGFLAAGISVLLVILLLPRMYQHMRVGRLFRGLSVGLGLVAVIAMLLWRGGGDARYSDFSRMRDLSDSHRIEVARGALESIASYPIIGLSMAEFEKIYPVAPHNTLLNAGVSHGVPGVVLVVFGYGILFWLLLQLGRGKLATRSSWIVFGSVLGVMNYLWFGMTHNASFLSGGSDFFMLFGIGAAAWRSQERQLQRDRSVLLTFIASERRVSKREA